MTTTMPCTKTRIIPYRMSRGWLMMSTTALSTVIALAAIAPQKSYAAQQGAADSAEVEEVVVTGSRVVRDGYEAPTPVTVIGVEALQTSATANIADAVAQLPALANGQSPQSGAINLSTGQNGVNGLNLRGMGTTRTLVLLNGQRTVGSTLASVVDVGELPQGLVQRVDIVTGGASAAYGSDALTGVVNFVLDTEYEGLKGEVSGGITDYGDNANYKVDATYGTSFGGGRGHFLLSGELVEYDGILQWYREWAKAGWDYINNPAYRPGNGLPSIILSDRVTVSNATAGGLITAGPLKGTSFGPGGSISRIEYGDIIAGTVMRGGSFETMDPTFTQGVAAVPEGSRQSGFMRISYDVSDDFKVYGQLGWGHQFNFSVGGPHYYLGNLSIKSDNAYIPESIRATLQAAGPTFLMGTLNGDMGPWRPQFDRRTLRELVGLEGSFDAMGTNWSWDAHFGYGEAWGTSRGINYHSFPRFAESVDAVRLANGSIVCRVNSDASTANDNPKCIPYNVFGIGVNTPEAIAYNAGNGDPYTHQKLEQTVAAINFAGDAFSTWAGPVSLAFGYEYRKEDAVQESNPQDIANQNYWTFSAGLPFKGAVTVHDVYAEAVVPLAKDETWARTLDLNTAVRGTNYSVYGWVATYKIGATYTPVDDVRLRTTYSRNIRSPTLIDLYTGGTTASVSNRDPFNGNVDTPSTNIGTGNPNLDAEKSRDFSLGVVYQPAWLEGFSASIDYYQIKIKGAIGTPGGQALLDLCFAGNQQACASITRTGSGATTRLIIRNQPINLATEDAAGLDIEGSYRKPMSDLIADAGGTIVLRGLATHYLKYDTLSGLPGDPIIHYAGLTGGGGGLIGGAGGVPSWRVTAALDYSNDPLSMGVQVRWISAGRNNARWIECTSGCPNPVGPVLTVDNNRVASAYFVDFNMNYKLYLGETTFDLFANVQNVMDRDPPVVAAGPGGTSWWTPAVPQGANFDTLGRTYRAGVRFKM